MSSFAYTTPSPPPPPTPKTPFTHVVYLYNDVQLSKGHLGSRGGGEHLKQTERHQVSEKLIFLGVRSFVDIFSGNHRRGHFYAF